MKPAAVKNVFILLMSGGFFVALFHKPLGLPDWAEMAGSIFGGLCVVVGIFVQRHAKKASMQPAPASTKQQKKQTFLILILVTITALSSPFWLPYTGSHLSFPQLVIVAIVGCAFCIAIVLFAARR